mmetsp:Transcript_9472/g.19124  ORF Transcript_9472/g.19124 Transcript_9472/m.19124 type:complete len:446 (-) Transcript_9472:91-1428(-)
MPMAPPAQSKRVPWYGASVKTLIKPLGCVIGTVTAALFAFAWTREDLAAGIDDVRFAEDKNIVRFSDHCAAPGDGAEGALAQGEAAARPAAWRLHSALALLGHGDSSAARPWPGDVAPATWDCQPEALPRYWRLNKHVQFLVIGQGGAKLDRSFTPDFLPPRPSEVAGESADDYVCAPGQLTAAGFRQAVFLGRHFAQAYGDLLSRGASGSASPRLHVRSVDTKRSLSSAVGLLMAFLAAPQLVKLFGDSSEVPIHVWPNATGSSSRIEEMELGDHLLARWCHQLPWPCRKGVLESERCVSVEQAAATVARGEAELCRSPYPDVGLSGPSLLASEVERLRRAEEGAFVLASTDGRTLTAALRLLLGDTVCDSPLSARPPFASRLVLERWSDPATAGFRWRVLWNGVDVSAKVKGCSGGADASPACSEAALAALLEQRQGVAQTVR